MKRSVLLWSLGITALLSNALAGCSCQRPANKEAAPAATATQSAPNTGLSFTPTPADEQRAAELAKTADAQSWEFGKGQWRGEVDKPAALYLLATSKEPAALGAALSALKEFVKPGKTPEADIKLLIKQHLLAEDRRVAARALALAKPALTGNPDPDLLKAVVDLGATNAYQSGRERVDVIHALSGVNPAQRKPGVDPLLLASLKSTDTLVLTTALRQMHNPRLRERPHRAFTEAALPHLQHQDPAVRGLAALVVGQSGKQQLSAAAPALVAALKDPHPFVRSQAAAGLALLDYTAAVHDLVPLADDLAKNSLEYEARTFEPRPSKQVLTASYWPHVAAAVQEAALRLAPKELNLRLPQPAPKDVPGTLKASAKALRVWYQANKSKLPKPGALPAESVAAGSAATPKAAPPAASGTPATPHKATAPVSAKGKPTGSP